MHECPYGVICSVSCLYWTLYGCTLNDSTGDFFLNINVEDNDAKD